MILVVDTRWSGRWTKGGLGDGQKEVWVIDKRWSGRWTKGGLGDRQKVVWVIDKRWSGWLGDGQKVVGHVVLQVVWRMIKR